MSKRIFYCCCFLLLLCTSARAQDELLSLLEETEPEETTLTPATFKGSRLINGHTVMTRRKGSLEFLIAHRFGRLNSGAYELFGLDNANVRFGLDYGLTDRLTVGFGRNSFEKTYDVFAKFAILRQQSGATTVPVSVTGFVSGAVNTLRPIDPDTEVPFSERVSYTYQLLVARKISPNFSVQLMPTLVHFNIVPENLSNDLTALGVGGRLLLTKRLSVNAEYYYRLQDRETDNYDALAIGIDLETGGHVFQLQFTNSRSMVEKGFIRETTGDFFGGDIHFGFNITRTF
ncbi:DUF5777 family beta-barrel protein [Lewinella sp. W8]|uniref:DUF5777 family beta-barrel protein n=1 Tax=Lewinella sp. W8 TaxID=2528208 RepID=UPI001067F463|nr:DUF5777 family beta-barrel protein [Lewinella sp. W8]MTB51729.1 hypothetical protein [Lewinella sp. W8]